ncbi:MAG: hypothetical protein Q8P64_17470 [Deltaproteobacteria bacterium]|nr:hypothetical protein [Deltaproteobacteria bacterium]
MDSIVVSFLSKLELGELQVFSNMAVFPLFTPLEIMPRCSLRARGPLGRRLQRGYISD